MKLDHLRTSVAGLTSVVASAIALLGGLSAAMRDASSDPEAVNALADSIDAQTHNLASAVAENTPASGPVAADAPAPVTSPDDPAPAFVNSDPVPPQEAE